MKLSKLIAKYEAVMVLNKVIADLKYVKSQKKGK